MPQTQLDVEKLAAGIAAEVDFGNNNKASANYRRSLCKVLVKRAIEEVLACK
jgi:CO/xanthine dehydrogenase FAD-binding subunit